MTMSEPTPAIADCDDRVGQAMGRLQRTSRRMTDIHRRFTEAAETLAQAVDRWGDLAVDIMAELPPGALRDDDE
jgi:hypothetical protein